MKVPRRFLFSIFFLLVILVLFESKAVATGRFINTTADIVHDRLTRLLWQTRPVKEKMNYSDAFEYCSNLRLDGESDWRLPRIKELASIIDEKSYSPSIYHYFQAASRYYWSVTLNAADHDFAWVVNFGDAHIHSFRKRTENYVRCVKLH